jgi:alpha-beta hydrolase superfamily lysophospholipase
VLVAALAAAGCGSAHESAKHYPPATPVATVCGPLPAGLKASAFWLRTSDGLRLYATSAGSGPHAVVLVHESGGASLCGWLQTMAWLGQNGFRAVALDLRGFPPSAQPSAAAYHRYGLDLQAAVDAAHGLGSKSVIVLGASMGGAAAIVEAPKLNGIDGVISLSGELNLPTSELDALAAAPHLRQPLLVLASQDDGYLDGADAHRLVRAAGSLDKMVHVYPGADHGWGLLALAPENTKVKATLLHWLRSHA